MKKNYLSALLVLGAVATTLTGLASCQKVNFNHLVPTDIIDVGSNIKQNGINVKRVNSGTNESGESYQSFTYSVTPEDAINQDVEVVATYNDGTDCSDVVTVSLNQDTKTILVTCHKAFSKQIVIEIRSVNNPLATASVTVDYEKKLESVEYLFKNTLLQNNYYSAQETINFGLTISDDSEIYNMIRDFSPLSFISPNYSEFSIDKNYTYSVDYSFPGSGERMIYVDEFCLPSAPSESLQSELTDSVNALLEGKVGNAASAIITGEEIYNLSSGENKEEWVNLLKSIDKKNEYYICFGVNLSIKCNEDPTKSIAVDEQYFNFFLDAFDENLIPVDDLTTETDGIIF